MPDTAPAEGRSRLILALDVPTVEAAERVVAETAGAVGVYKIGLQLIFAGGLALAERLRGEGHRVFLDAKLHDIDNTVAAAVRSITALGVDYLTVHAYPKTLRAAVAGRGTSALSLLAVTVLTSMDDEDMMDAGYAMTAEALVERRARQAADANFDGIVCSPHEAAAVRALVPQSMTIVTPGVRPAGGAAGDQKRVMTPADAIRAGADLVVVGRPILGARDRRAAAHAIAAELDAALPLSR